jgi:hypothetical protein
MSQGLVAGHCRKIKADVFDSGTVPGVDQMQSAIAGLQQERV